MASKKLIGIEIGNYRMSMAVCDNGNLQQFVNVKLPDNLVRENEIVSWEAMADFLKEVIDENKISAKNVAMILPSRNAYVRRVTMPAMTVDQLRVNMPYEFHDYITEDMDKYNYDYSLIEMINDEEGKPKEMDMMLVAAPKEIIEKYKTMLRRAGLRLALIAPEVFAFKNIIKDYEEANHVEEKKDYAILDIGHSDLRLHFFTGGEFEITRIMEPGCNVIASYLADKTGQDAHIAQMNEESNKDNVVEDDALVDLYNQMAVEIMRVLNFYNFNHPGNNLDKIYYCGGGSRIKPLIAEIASMIEVELVSISELITDKTPFMDELILGPQSLGIVWE